MFLRPYSRQFARLGCFYWDLTTGEIAKLLESLKPGEFFFRLSNSNPFVLFNATSPPYRGITTLLVLTCAYMYA
jgi:hypothetical protein